MRYGTLLLALTLALAAMALPLPAHAAGCPLAIDALSLAGSGASGKAVMYELDVDVNAPTPLEAILVVHTTHGVVHLTWSGINPPSNISPEQASFWFERPSEDVTSVSVESAAGKRCPDTATSVTGSGSDDETVVTVYDDSVHHDELVDDHSHDTTAITDADFKNKVYPQYPDIARETDTEGVVEVGIEIGTDGKALYGWVRARDTTAQSTVLDNAALYAALTSTYNAAVADGKPIQKQYLIVYTFELDGGTARSLKMSDLCPIVLEAVGGSNTAGTNLDQWYSLSVEASEADVTSAVIGVQDVNKKAVGLVWSPVDLHQSPDDPKSWYGAATFNWYGAPVSIAWVDSVTTSSGKVVRCQPVVAALSDLSSQSSHLRYLEGDPAPELGLQQLTPARFTHQIVPDYPVDASKSHTGGDADVEVLVDENGAVKEAFVTSSSGNQSLDSAALLAAEKSTYKPAVHGVPQLYQTRYCFIP